MKVKNIAKLLLVLLLFFTSFLENKKIHADDKVTVTIDFAEGAEYSLFLFDNSSKKNGDVIEVDRNTQHEVWLSVMGGAFKYIIVENNNTGEKTTYNSGRFNLTVDDDITIHTYISTEKIYNFYRYVGDEEPIYTFNPTESTMAIPDEPSHPEHPEWEFDGWMTNPIFYTRIIPNEDGTMNVSAGIHNCYAIWTYKNITISTYLLSENEEGNSDCGSVWLYNRRSESNKLYPSNFRTNTVTGNAEVYNPIQLVNGIANPGYHFVGWKILKKGQNFDDVDYVKKQINDISYMPESSDEKLLAVFDNGEIRNVALRYQIKDTKDNPIEGAQIKIKVQKKFLFDTTEVLTNISDKNGVATSKEDIELEFDAGNNSVTYTYPSSIIFEKIPSGYAAIGPNEYKKLTLLINGKVYHLLDDKFYYGYQLANSGSADIPWSMGVDIFFEAYLQKILYGGISVEKFDSSSKDKKLENAKFEIVANIVPLTEQECEQLFDIYAYTNEEIENLSYDDRDFKHYYEILFRNDKIIVDGKEYKDGDVVATLTTDKNGKASTGIILPNMTSYSQKVVYTIKEVEAPKDYEIEKEIIAEKITLGDQENKKYEVGNKSTKKEEPEKPKKPEKPYTVPKTGVE